MNKNNLWSCFKKLTVAGLVGGMLFSTATAGAVKVYLNGVDIDGVTSQTFNNCTVTLDARGDVFITAKGYQIQSVGGGDLAAPTAAPSANGSPVPTSPAAVNASAPMAANAGPVKMHYWLFTETAARGMAQYDIDLYINNRFVKRINYKDEQLVEDVTEFMRTGTNNVYIVAKKNTTDGRFSTSPQHYIKVSIGESASAGGQELIIDKEVLSYTRNASESQNFTDMFNITGR